MKVVFLSAIILVSLVSVVQLNATEQTPLPAGIKDFLNGVIQSTNLEIMKEDLSHLAIVREVDTPALNSVHLFLEDAIRSTSNRWLIEEDRFTAKTPYGEKTFTNVIATLTPPTPASSLYHLPRIVLAAHSDSKYFPPPNEFVGATDSAIPMAIILEVARCLTVEIEKAESSGWEMNTLLQIIFFDGEEAFKEWSSEDSLYGSRHLAEKWGNSQPNGKSLRKGMKRGSTMLSSIELFVLLDLIGDKNGVYYSWFEQTHDYFNELSQIETSLRNANTLRREPTTPLFIFSKAALKKGIDDDHKPFLDRGVPILHLIPHPFPEHWHTARDTVQNANDDVIYDFTTCIKLFLAKRLGLFSRFQSQ